MSDHPKSPKNPFNFNAKTEEERKADQQNKSQAINKTDTLKFTINGTQGGRANVEIEEGGKKTKASFEPEKSNMVWHRVIDGGPNKNGLTFELTLKDENSKMLLDDSDIEQMDISKDGVLLARFDNGWKHETHNEQALEFIEELKEKFEDYQRDFEPIAKDKGRDRDR
jgi:hypothetical protein